MASGDLVSGAPAWWARKEYALWECWKADSVRGHIAALCFAEALRTVALLAPLRGWD